MDRQNGGRDADALAREREESMWWLMEAPPAEEACLPPVWDLPPANPAPETARRGAADGGASPETTAPGVEVKTDEAQETCAGVETDGAQETCALAGAAQVPAADDEIMALLYAQALKLSLAAQGGGVTRSQYAAQREKPLCVDSSPRGTRKRSPLLLAQNVAERESIVSFRLDSGESVRYYYRGGVYRPCPDERVKERVQTELLKVDETLYRFSAVTEAANAIFHMKPAGDLQLLDADERTVNLKNGLLDLSTLRLSFHTPLQFSTVQLDAVWTETDAPTPAFDRLLGGICGGDPAKERLLLRFIGLCLTNARGWKLKKALFLYGPGNTGKSVLRNFVEAVLGEGSYMNVDLQTLEEDKFASARLVGKRLTGTSDMGFLKVRQLALFKQLTGGDKVYAQNKGKQPFSFRYGGFLWFCMNEPPLFGGDRGDWVYDRIILFRCGDSVPAAERDPALPEKLWQERSAIVRKLLLAAKTVMDNGWRLDVPESVEAGKAAYRQENDPVEKFFMTCCRLRPTPDISPLDECTSKNVFEVFKRWCADNAPGYLPKKSEFKKTCAALLALPEEEILYRTKRNQYFTFTLRDEIIGEYGDGLFLKVQ